MLNIYRHYQIILRSLRNIMATNNAINQIWPMPAFYATLSAPVLNVTGDGSDYTLIADTELYDYGANYNNGTGTFVAPVAGLYQFSTTMLVDPVIIGAGLAGYVKFHTSVTDYVGGTIIASYSTFALGNALTAQFTTTIHLIASETVNVVISITQPGGAKNIDILANVVIPTSFNGYLIRQSF